MEWGKQNKQLNEVVRMIEFENSFVHVWVDEEILLLHSEWKRDVTSKEYRQGHYLFIKLLKKYGIKFWIVDSTKLGDISSEDEEWFFNVIIPEIIKTRIVKAARLTGENQPIDNRFESFYNKVRETYEAFSSRVEIRNYMTYKEAADWMGEIHD